VISERRAVVSVVVVVVVVVSNKTPSSPNYETELDDVLVQCDGQAI